MNNKYILEFKQLIKIGIPIFGSQMSYMLMGTADTIIAGRASANDLAGLAVGTAFAKSISFLRGLGPRGGQPRSRNQAICRNTPGSTE